MTTLVYVTTLKTGLLEPSTPTFGGHVSTLFQYNERLGRKQQNKIFQPSAVYGVEFTCLNATCCVPKLVTCFYGDKCNNKSDIGKNKNKNIIVC